MNAAKALWSTPERRYWIAASVIAVLWSIHVGDDGYDLRVYREGARVLAHGGPIYDVQFTGGESLIFTYPPFAAFAMMPFAALPATLSAYLWTGLSILMLALFLRLSVPATFAQRTVPLCVALAGCLHLEPVRKTFDLGQINLVLAAVIMFDLVSRKHPGRGFLLGLAAGVKLTPLIFFPLLVLTRQWTALRNAAIGLATTLVVGFATAPHESWRYWTGMSQLSTRIGSVHYVSNQSVMGFLARISGDRNAVWVHPTWLVVCAVLVLNTLFLARHRWQADDHVGSVALCALGGLFASPISWSHHWVWVIPLGVTLVRTIRRRSRRAITAIGVGAVWYGWFWLGLIWYLPKSNGREFGWTVNQSLIGNSYIILGLVALTYLNWVWWSERSAEQTPAADTSAPSAPSTA